LGLTSRSIDDWLISRVSDLVLISRTKIFTTGDQLEIRQFLSGEQQRLSFLYEKFWYISADGDFWNTENHTGNMAGHELIRQFVQEQKNVSFFIPAVTDLLFYNSIVIAVPVYRKQGSPGVLCASMPFSWFQRVIQYFSTDFFKIAVVTIPSGKVISHSNDSLIGQKEEEIYHKVFTVNSRHEENRVFVATLRNQWKLMTMIPEEELFYQVRQTTRFYLALIFGFLVVIALVSWAITQIVVKPIGVLTEGVKNVMKGDYNQQISIDSTNEINMLAKAFNEMNRKLSQKRTDDRFIFLGHLSARMAHEIRKPLNIIQLITQAVKRRGEFTENDYQSILIEIDNADRFVREILEFVKPDELSLSLYSLRKLILAVIEKFSLKFRKNNIQVFHELEENIPDLFLDIFRMEQVISNILNNAVQAIGKNGRIGVILKSDDTTTKVILEISDTGSGIDPEIRDKIFDPYFSTKENGIGLGLSICYRILMGHGAEIEADNSATGGALIRITFSAPA
jgi:signal transduction histidine kinase